MRNIKAFRKFADPKTICLEQAKEIGREFWRIQSAPPGDQIHSAKRLHRHVLHALERFDHWLGRIDDHEWLEQLWGPIFVMIERSFDALEAHLKEYPDPEIARVVEGYRKTMRELEENQTAPGVLELPFEVN